jgi:hypothetical protein
MSSEIDAGRRVVTLPRAAVDALAEHPVAVRRHNPERAAVRHGSETGQVTLGASNA